MDNNTSITQNIEALLAIAAQVQNGGDLVIASCRTGKVPRFLKALHKLTYGRINVYTLIKRSNFPYSTASINGQRASDGGLATVTAISTLNNVSLIQDGLPKSAVAYLFPAGMLEGGDPILLDEIKLTKEGVKYIHGVTPLKFKPLENTRTAL